MVLSIRGLMGVLRAEYGDPHWWPGDSEFEVVVGAILTQRATWENAESAIARIKQLGLMSPWAMVRCRRSVLEGAIRTSGFYRQKARYLVAVSRFIETNFDGDVKSMREADPRGLRNQLLEIEGVGPETADSILLYALGIPSFVVDAYTVRLLARLRIRTSGYGYDAIKSAVENEFKRDPKALSDLHALIVIHCKSTCRAAPKCCGCCMRRYCPSKSE